MKLSFQFSIMIILVLATAAVGANAQIPEDEQSALPDTLTVYEVEGIIVERTRLPEATSTVATTRIGADEIASLPFDHDVTMTVGGSTSAYSFSDSGHGFGYSYLKIRGFDQERLGMLLNGVPLNDPESHHVYWVDHGDILGGGASINVQRGIGTTLFGASSFGGSVDVVTSPLALEPGIHLQTSYGTFTDSDIDSETRRYRAALSSGDILDGRGAFSARFSRLKSDGYRNDSGTDQESFALSGIYRDRNWGHKADILVGNEVTHFAWDGISPQYGFDLDDRDDRRFNPYSDYANNVDDFRQSIASVSSHYELSNRMRITNTAYAVDGVGFFEQFKTGEDFFDYGLSGTPGDNETDLVRRRWLDNHYWGFIPQLHTSVGSARTTFGVGFRRYEAEHYGDLVWTDADVSADALTRYYQYRTDKTSFEAFGRAEIPLSRSTLVTAAFQYQGHRYDWSQCSAPNFSGYAFEADHDFVSPRIGVRHNTEGGLGIFGSVSYQEREPADRDYLDGDDPQAVPQFADVTDPRNLRGAAVQPESVVDVELGASLNKTDWSASVTLYQLEFNDELIPLDGGRILDDGNFIRANADRSRHQGVELEARAMVTSGLELSGNVSLARHRFVDHEVYAYWVDDVINYEDNAIPRSPEVLGNFTARWTRDRLRTHAHVQHVGKQYVDGVNTESLAIDPFTVVHAGIAYDIGRALNSGRSVELDVRVNNVFDSLYETYGYGFFDSGPVGVYWPGATRSVFVGVNLGL